VLVQPTTRRAAVPPPDPTEALEALFRSHYRGMVRLAFAMTGSAAVAEELVQDCFVRLHRRIVRLEHPAAYLRTAVVNACREHHRRRYLERTRHPEPLPESAPPEVRELWDALAVLNPRQRAAVVLRFYEDLSEAEIATELGCRPGTVKSLLSRALAKLREVVEK
jgi:RNA polymerase sigma-70 factor (sigma-E family)